MGKKNNKKKRERLGMPYGTASNRLRKQVMFSLLQDLGRDVCFQCGERIENAESLSMEHKEPWLNSDNPIGTFFDLTNIAFSHFKCNSGAGAKIKGQRSKHGTRQSYERWGCRCLECTADHQQHNALRKERGYR